MILDSKCLVPRAPVEPLDEVSVFECDEDGCPTGKIVWIPREVFEQMKALMQAMPFHGS